MPGLARTALVIAACLGGAGAAEAGGLDLDPVGPRAIGRAGAQVVSGDGGAALLVNPAGLARRGEARVQLGIGLHDLDADYRPADADASNSPTVADRSEPLAAPLVAASASAGPLVIGAAVLVEGRLERAMPAPEFGQPEADVARLFPHRYGGLELGYRRRTVVLGAAARVGEWLGVGLAAGASDILLRERRRIWAGFAGRDPLGSPARDLDLMIEGEDRLVPVASGGALIAPPELPLEMAIGLSWSGDAYPDGRAVFTRTSDLPYPEPLAGPGDGGRPQAETRVGGPTVLRGGVRYLGRRITAELDGELVWYREAGKLPEWRTRDLAVRDQTGQTAPLGRVPSLVALRNHGAVRAAVDLEAVAGFLWLTAGYAYATAATARAHLQPAWGDLGGHTAAVGAEASWNQITFTLGYARQMAPAARLEPGEGLPFVNPFAAGTAPAAAGRHRRARDSVALSVEVAWP
ncbi:MAG TPA: hypothetical protein VKZ63_11045 [Kofleriaceae bacterium]|nr:hypothetical protein [Kofleriaceae bacterium]